MEYTKYSYVVLDERNKIKTWFQSILFSSILIFCFIVDYKLLNGSIIFQLLIVFAMFCHCYGKTKRISFSTKEEAIKYITELKD